MNAASPAQRGDAPLHPGSPAGTFVSFVLALLLAMLFAAAASPWVQRLLSPLAEFPLHRVFSRLTMLGVIVCTVWVMRRHGLARRDVLGFDLPFTAFLRGTLKGLAGGLLLMAAALVPLFLLGLREWNPERLSGAGMVVLLVLRGLASGLLVALIEETFFRGAMQGALMRQNAPRLALLAVPAFYAAVHFLGRAASVPADEVTALSGFIALGGFFTLYSEPLRILDAFIALYLVGLLLALVRQRWGDISRCIGLHAGFVTSIAVIRKISRPADSEWSFLVGDYDGLLGIWIALLTALVCVALRLQSRRLTR